MNRFFIQDSVMDLSYEYAQKSNINISETEDILRSSMIIQSLTIKITAKDDVRHISKVLRLIAGDTIEIVDVDARLFVCKIISVGELEVCCEIISQEYKTGESPVDIVLYQGLPKGEKFDLIIQKSVELGVHRIVPVIFDRCVVKWKDDKSSLKKHTRWNRISYEAAKQSKRCVIPKVDMPIKIEQLVKEIGTVTAQDNTIDTNKLNLLFYEDEAVKSLKDVIVDFKENSDVQIPLQISVIVGAEGGIENFEVEKLKNAGAKSVSLGNRILRTETAGIVTTALIQYELGDLG